MFSIISEHPILTAIICVAILATFLARYSIRKTKATLKKWQPGDTLVIGYGVGANDYYKLAEMHSPKFSGGWNKGPLAHLVKWSDDECLIELGNGSQYFIKMSAINGNWSLANRERKGKMDQFMKDIPSNKQEIRDDKINDILKKF
jgi:hypothetical protein